MRGVVAKECRRGVYGDLSPRARAYGERGVGEKKLKFRDRLGQWVERIIRTGTRLADDKRGAYQALKAVAKATPRHRRRAAIAAVVETLLLLLYVHSAHGVEIDAPPMAPYTVDAYGPRTWSDATGRPVHVDVGTYDEDDDESIELRELEDDAGDVDAD